MTKKIAVLEPISMNEDQRSRLEALGTVSWYETGSNEENAERVKDQDVVIIDWTDPNPFLSSMKSPSLLALMSTGYDWIDLEKAREHRVSVSNVPGYAAEAVAEHVFALALSVARRIPFGDRGIREGNTTKGNIEGIEVSEKTIGIIGLGSIGGRVAEIARCFGMKVLTFNRTPKNISGVKDVALDELLTKSDLVCVTCSLNDDSEGMLNSENLTLIRNTAILVATTWGIVDIDAIALMLREKKLRGAGLDVAVEAEEIDLPQDILEVENLVLSPHCGFNTKEARIRQLEIVIGNITSYLQGSPNNILTGNAA